MKREGVLKIFRTTVLKCDTPTITGRVYPLDLIKKSLKNDKVLQEKLVNHTFYGDMGNKYDPEVNLSKVAFNVEKLYWYKNELKAKIAILDTPAGQDLMKIYKKVAFRTAGVGDMNFEKIITNYELDRIVVVHRAELQNETNN